MPPGYDERLKAAGIDPGAVAPCDFHRVPAMTLVCERCGVDFTPEALMTDVSNSPSDIKPKPLRNLKNCDGKAPLNLLPAKPLRAIASAFHDGATIYEPWDWAEKTDGCREMYVAAALRHLLAYADPDDNDYTADSGVHHLAAAGANIMILLHHDEIDYHVPDSVAEPDEPIPYYVPADAKQVPPTAEPLLEELRSLPTNEPRCSKRWDHRQCQLGVGHGGTHVYDPDKEPSVLAGDVRAQCPAYDQNSTRCLKDDEHEGLHENDSAIWNDGACQQGCP